MNHSHRSSGPRYGTRKARVLYSVVNTVNFVVDEYLAAVKPTLSMSSWKDYRRALDLAKAAWGELPIEGIRSSHVKKMMDGLAKLQQRPIDFCP